MKKTITIIFCALLAVIAGITAVFIIIKVGKKAVIPPLSSQISGISEESDAIPVDTPPPLPEPAVLSFSSPKNEKFTTTEDKITFSGNFTKNTVVLLENEEIMTDNDGNFSVTKELNYGNNTFTFKAGGRTKTFVINRRFVVISSFSSNSPQTYSAGAKFPVTVFARQGSNITAVFNGVTISLTPSGDAQNGFINYSGSFSLPTGHFRDLNLGTVTFNGTYESFSETFTSGKIVCKKEDTVLESDPNATPKGGRYTDVGSGIITEIVSFQAETFDAGTNNDISKPYNNYLPKGTVDYGSSNSIAVKRDGYTYNLTTLRCGRSVYNSYPDKPTKNVTTVIKQYLGTLPDHNEITFNSLDIKDSHTVLNLGVNWKAPFYFELLPQQYNGDFTVSNISYNYVDITFCYATVFNGEVTVPQDNPVFSSAKIIKNANDITVRLHLKKAGRFYGWDSYYDENGNLCFEFLNPKTVTQTQDNIYGVDLSGVNILIDVGHGGSDCGALGTDGAALSEANRNLALAEKIKAQLVSIGANVYLTRSSNVTSTFNDKMLMIKKIKPDYCIAIHHDSNTSKSLNGFGSYYHHPFSKKAAEFVLNNTFNTGIYKKSTFKFHKYFILRSSVCPVVLTENGYMSNGFDFANIKNEQINNQKAEAIVKGIAEYFLSIQ